MQDHIIDVSRDWPSLLFTGLGITFSLVAYVRRDVSGAGGTMTVTPPERIG